MDRYINDCAVVVLNAGLKSIVLILLALLTIGLSRALRRDWVSVQTEHRVWTIVMVSLLALPLLTWFTPQWSVPLALNWMPNSRNRGPTPTLVAPINRPSTSTSRDESEALKAVGTEPQPNAGAMQSYDQLLSASVPLDTPGESVARALVPQPVEIDEAPVESVRWTSVGVAIWLSGCILLALRLCLSWWQTRRIISRTRAIDLFPALEDAMPAGCQALESDDLKSPVVNGLFRFQIILPANWRDWAPAKLAAVLAHESEHIQRRDGLITFLSAWTGILYWFNPLVWLGHGRLVRLAELACDQAAAIKTGNRFDYARQLLEIATSSSHQTQFHPGIAMAARSDISHRIESLLDTARPLTHHASRLFLAGWLLLGLPTLLFVAAAAPATDEPTAPDKAVSDKTTAPNGATSDENRSIWTKADRMWMNGDKLVLQMRGEVLMPDGSPAVHPTVKAASTAPIQVRVQGNRFEFDLERGHRFEPVASILASAADGTLMGIHHLHNDQVRNAASKVVQVRLAPSWSTDIKVMFEGKPVSGARVVIGDSQGHDLGGQTNADGIFTARIPASESLERIAAFTDDQLIGGYQFSRGPLRDPRGKELFIELSRCRPQKVRLLDEHDRPIAGLAVTINVATAEHYNFIPRRGKQEFVSDANGELIDSWFPDWDDANFYVELVEDDTWYLTDKGTMKDGVIVARLAKSDAMVRKRITGQVELPRGIQGGFWIRMGSFEHPQEGRYDPIYARCDVQGKFTADVIRGATYCMTLDDSEWVSDFWVGILYDPKTDEYRIPRLKPQLGEPVDITVTQGLNRAPMKHTTVSLKNDHQFEWHKGGETRGGSLGKQWWVTTDELGKATTRAAVGPVESYIYLPDWRPSQTTNVVAGKRTTIEFHREVPGKRPISGQVRVPVGSGAILKGAKVQLLPMDHSTNGSVEAWLDSEGRFSVEMAAARIGLYVRTPDGLAAGSWISDHPDQGITRGLLPTAAYRGQLLDENDQPLPGRWVRLVARMTDPKADRERTQLISTTFDVDQFEAITDESGKFEFPHVPLQIGLRVSAQENSTDPSSSERKGSKGGVSFGERYLQPGEVRPLDVLRMKTQRVAKPAPPPFAEKLQSELMRCQLSRTHLLAGITADKQAAERAAEFIQAAGAESTSSYLRLFWDLSDTSEEQAQHAFLVRGDWKRPGAGEILLVVMDAEGKALADTVIALPDSDEGNLTQSEPVKALQNFLHTHAPQQVDAQQVLDAALQDAKSSARNVWLQFSQPWCGPCYPLARWLQSQQPLLKKDYVIIKIDNYRDKHGSEIWDRFTEGIHHGIPFTVVLSPEGKKLIDSAGPLGNVGNPTTFDDLQHFRQMITMTSQRLTSEEIERLLNHLCTPK